MHQHKIELSEERANKPQPSSNMSIANQRKKKNECEAEKIRKTKGRKRNHGTGIPCW